MKKITSIAIALAAVMAAGAAQADRQCSNMSGYSIGVGPSFRALQGNWDVWTELTTANIRDYYKMSSSTGTGMVYASAGHQGWFTPSFYAGVDVVGDFGRNRASFKNVDDSGDGYYNFIKHTHAVGGDLRLGYVRNNDTLYYIKVGGRSGRFKAEYVDLTGLQPDRTYVKHDTKGGFGGGLGVETKVGKFRLRGEVSHMWYAPVKIKDLKVRAGVNPVTSFAHPRTFNAMVGAAYCW